MTSRLCKSEAKASCCPVAGRIIIHKPRLLHVSGWGMGQTKKQKHMSHKLFSKMFLPFMMVLVHIYSIRLDSITNYLWYDQRDLPTAAPSLDLNRLWLQMMSSLQHDSVLILNSLAAFMGYFYILSMRIYFKAEEYVFTHVTLYYKPFCFVMNLE